MAYDAIASPALSNNFRAYFLLQDNATQLEIIASLLEATSVKAERNVRLWFETGAGFRNILNRTLSADEFILRESIVKACLRINNENVPTKMTSSVATRKANAVKFAEYMKDRYTGRFVRSITFSSSGFTFSYDTYGRDEIDPPLEEDEDFLEYTTEPLPDDILADFF